jgi:hypothetical protein
MIPVIKENSLEEINANEARVIATTYRLANLKCGPVYLEL